MDVTVVVPTSGRAGYLEVTLESLRGQSTAIPHELLVVDDGSSDATGEVAGRFGVRAIRHDERRGLNAARNTGLREARGDLIAFVDDDVFVPPGWLDAIVEGARRHPEADAFGGPIRARFEGHAPRGCGREDPPITTLDLGAEDVEAEMVWGANFAVRRSAVERIGEFDDSFDRGHGDEEEWLLRLRAAGGRIDVSGRRRPRPPPCGRRLRARLPRPRRLPPRPRRPVERLGITARRPAWGASCATWRVPAGTPCAGPARRE